MSDSSLTSNHASVTTTISTLVKIRNERLDKVKKLHKMGINPYPERSSVIDSKNQAQTIIDKYNNYEGKTVVLAGRLMSWRSFGALTFANLQDISGQIQLYIKAETLSPTSIKKQILGTEDLNLLDVGDFVEVSGEVTKTKKGQISVLVKEIRLLTKTLRPLPDKWHGITDKEARFRRRYVDMTMNPEIRQRFTRRALFWQAHREFLNKHGFVEVNIPVLEHVPGGGDARPFTTHVNATHEDVYLRISHELPLKRLVGAGFDKVYDIGPRFRNEGISDEHLPEHVAMEYYWAYANWQDGMKFQKELINYVIKRVYGERQKFKIRGFEVDFSTEWQILDFGEIFQKRFSIDVYEPNLDEIKVLLKKNDVTIDDSLNIPRGVDALWKIMRRDIAGPAFLINHPKYLSPLQKVSKEDPRRVDRCQAIIAGSEQGNGWSELNDPINQFDRFYEQQALRNAGDEEAQWMDIDYVEMLEYGMPPTFGWGHSERLFWFLEGVTAKEGVPFPYLKQEINQTTRKIYPQVDFAEME